MISDADMHVFVYDPNELIVFCRRAVARIIEEHKNDGYQEKNLQLTELKKVIRRFESQGISVPDLVRVQCEQLEESINNCDYSTVMDTLIQGFSELIGDLRRQESKVSHTHKEPITTREELRRVLLIAMKELGEGAEWIRILNAMEKKLEGRLLPGDFRPDKSYKFRWRDNATGVRQRLMKDGVIKKDPISGKWELC